MSDSLNEPPEGSYEHVRHLARHMDFLIRNLVADRTMARFDRIHRLDSISKACSTIRDEYAEEIGVISAMQARNLKDSSEFLRLVADENSQTKYAMKTIWESRKRYLTTATDELGPIVNIFNELHRKGAYHQE